MTELIERAKVWLEFCVNCKYDSPEGCLIFKQAKQAEQKDGCMRIYDMNVSLDNLMEVVFFKTIHKAKIRPVQKRG